VKEVFSEVKIQAPAERIWQVLTDFASYPEWNPFIRRISGQPKEGTRLKVYIEPPGAKEVESGSIASFSNLQPSESPQTG
jgi:uncharacterized membrane protein